MYNGLVLHCGAKTIDRASLDDLVLPPQTDTYFPIPHGQYLDMVLETYSEVLPVELERVNLGLTREGARMFFTADFKAQTKGAEWGISIGGRNSTDKSFGAALCSGSKVFVCDNMCISGSSAMYMRKHTKNQAALAWDQFGQMEADLTSFRDLPMSNEQVWASLGVLMGRGVVKSGELIKAAKYWSKCPHEEHATGDLFAFYQAVNHALKGSPPESIMAAHCGLHDFALDCVEVEGQVWELPPRVGGEA
jgi:hypothetical protein